MGSVVSLALTLIGIASFLYGQINLSKDNSIAKSFSDKGYSLSTEADHLYKNGMNHESILKRFEAAKMHGSAYQKYSDAIKWIPYIVLGAAFFFVFGAIFIVSIHQ